MINCRAGQEMVSFSQKIFEIRNVSLFHTGIKPKPLQKILEIEDRKQDPPTKKKKKNHQSYVYNSLAKENSDKFITSEMRVCCEIPGVLTIPLYLRSPGECSSEEVSWLRALHKATHWSRETNTSDLMRALSLLSQDGTQLTASHAGGTV